MSIPGSFVAGDVLTAAELNALPGGVRDHAIVTTSQTSIGTSLTDLTSVTATWTALSSRLYRTSFYGFFNDSSDAAFWEVEIADGSNTRKQLTRVDPAAAGYQRGVSFSVIETGLSGSITRKVRARTSVGTFTFAAGSSIPGFITVEDIGPA